VLFVAGGRQGDRGPLAKAVAATDAELDKIRTALADRGVLDASAITALQNAEGGFTQLPVLRSEVGSSVVGADDVSTRYTSIVQRAGVLERALLRQGASADGAGLADALAATSQAREALALQHTTIAGAIAARQLTEQNRITVTGTDAAFTSAFADYQVALTPEQLGRYGNFATDAANVDRERLRTEIMAAPVGKPLTADAAAWDGAYRSSVAVVDRAAGGVSGELSAASVAAQDSASNQAGVNSVILMLGVLLGIAIIVLLARSLIRSLRVLRRSALEVAEEKLPAAVESLRSGSALNAMVEPVPLAGRDEVGQVARAFDAVHGQAIRLAADQAALQSNVSNMFVNLSRRSQALVERQLQLIEQLESNEQDPDQLSNLFQLDHLATRMRRNSENLLVLAGTDLAKRNVAPVPVVDVLRAAVSEIEQYQRVVVQPPPVATVAGRAASDLVHLLAELLDNATNFSPPDSQVVMSTTRANDGSLIVEIADRGVGMAEHELAEANQRLSAPAAVDVSASRRMGLFVVGRLANRHGLGIRLGGGLSGGTGGLTASVTVPSTLVPSAEPVDRRHARAGAVPSGAAAYAGAPAAPVLPPTPAPAASPALPEQRPSDGSGPGRSLSSLVAGNDGPMSPAPAFGGGRPPSPPVNGSGLPTRRPGSAPPPDGADAGREEEPRRPAGPEGGPWPVESLRKPPNGTVVPTRRTNGSTPAEGPAGLPKRTPGVNGASMPQSFAGSGSGRESDGASGPSAFERRPAGEPPSLPRREPRRVGGEGDGARVAPEPPRGGPTRTPGSGEPAGVGPAGADADRSRSGAGRTAGEQAEEPTVSASAAPVDTDTPATGATPEAPGNAQSTQPPAYPSGLPRRSPPVNGSTPIAPSGLPRRVPSSGEQGSTAERGAGARPAEERDAVARPAGGGTRESTKDSPRDAATAESTQAAPTAESTVSPAVPATDGAASRTSPTAEDAAAQAPAADGPDAQDTAPTKGATREGAQSEPTPHGEEPRSGSALPSRSADARPDTSADSASTERAEDAERGDGRGAAAALGAAALGAAAFGTGAAGRTRSEDAPADPEKAAEQARPSDAQADTGLPQRRPLAGRPESRPAEQFGGLPRRTAGAESTDSATAGGGNGLSGGPTPRETPPIGPAGLPQRQPRRPVQGPTGNTDALFSATTPGESQTTGQLRRPGGFASRTPSRRPADGPTSGATERDPATGAPAETPAGSARTEAPQRTDGWPTAGGSRPGPGETAGQERSGLLGEPSPAGNGSAGMRPSYGGPAETRPRFGPSDGAPTFGAPTEGRPSFGPQSEERPGASTEGRPSVDGDPDRPAPSRLGGLPMRRPGGYLPPNGFTGGAPGRPDQGSTGFGEPTDSGQGSGGPLSSGPSGSTPASRSPGAPTRATEPGPARPAPSAPDDAGLPGSSGATPSRFDLGQTTPIFEEIASAWFRSNGDVPVRWAEGGSDGEATAAREAAPAFPTAADEGWRVADATAQATAAESEKQAETTDAGLPKRRPRARLVPGSAAGSAVLAPPSGPARNAEAIRGRLASYQQGVRQGRESRLRRQSSGSPEASELNEENR